MRTHQDPFVNCPYDKAHKMPAKRLIWHFAKCKAKQERFDLGLPDFHCKFNCNHIFLSQEELQAHELDCQLKVDQKKEQRLEDQQTLNKALENSQDGDDLKAYRADQIEDARITTSNLLMDWNQESKPLSPKNSKSGSSEINEEEVGRENFERYKNMPSPDQKIARVIYRQKLMGEEGCMSTKAHSNASKKEIMPDGM